MDESKEWGLDMAHLREEIKSARARGVLPKALVVINPGNPVGNVLTEQDLTDLVKLCKEERLILLSDEVQLRPTPCGLVLRGLLGVVVERVSHSLSLSLALFPNHFNLAGVPGEHLRGPPLHLRQEDRAPARAGVRRL